VSRAALARPVVCPLARGNERIDARARNRAHRSFPRLAGTVALLAGLLVAGSARADASVVVEVKRSDGSSADGTVRLTKGETHLQCVTAKGRCEIKNVPGGAYSVELEQAGKPAGKAKTVMIPPAGAVKLIVAAS
jgi:hypothetical protein